MNERGYTLIEVLVVTLLIAGLMGTATVGLKALNNPLVNAAHQTTSYFKKVRAKAIATTQAVLVAPTSNSQIAASVGVNCDNTNTEDPALTYDLPTGSFLVDPDWEVCYSTRGIASNSFEIQLQDQEGVIRTIEILLGGAVREV